MSTRKTIPVLAAALTLIASIPVCAQEGPPPAPTARTTESSHDSDTDPAESILPFELPTAPDGPAITLEEALRLADDRNLSLEATRIEIERADASLYQARATLFPKATAGMTYSHMDHADTANFGGNSITTRRQDALSANIDVSVPLINPTAWAGISAARVGVDTAELTVENARQSLLLMVAQSYYQALTIQTQISVLEEQLDAAARYHEIARTRLVSGVGQRLDVIRAKGDLVRLREGLITANASLVAARDSLAILTGMEELPRPVDTELSAATIGTEEELEEQAMSNRQDLKLKKAVVELSEKQLTVAWMQFLPSLNGSWQLTHQFTEMGDMGDSDPTRWTAYLMLSVPIYSQTRYADLDLKRAEIKKAELEAMDAQRSAALEVRTARRDYSTALQKVGTAAEQAELSKESLKLTENEYVLGTGSSLAVTDARRTSTEAEINLTARRLEAQLSLLKLLKAVGTDISSVKTAGN